MPKRFAYPAYVNLQLKGKTKAEQQAIRNEYFSDYGRVANYDRYVKFCRDNNYVADRAPEGYAEWSYKGYEGPTNLLIAGLGALMYLIIGIIAGSTGMRKR